MSTCTFTAPLRLAASLVRKGSFLVALLAAVGFAAPARALHVEWTLNGDSQFYESTSPVLPTGPAVSGSISGSFIYDTNAFDVISGSFTVSGLPDSTYNQTYQVATGADTSLIGLSALGFAAGDPVLYLQYQDISSLVTPGDTVQLHPSIWSSLNECTFCNSDGSGASNNVYVFDGTASVTSVPEPATSCLLASGLGLLGWIRRRQAD